MAFDQFTSGLRIHELEGYPLTRVRVMRECREDLERYGKKKVTTIELDSELWETAFDEQGLPLDTDTWSAREVLEEQLSRSYESIQEAV